MDAWTQFLTAVVYPTVALAVPALISVGVAYLIKHLGLQTALQQAGDARLAVQGAVATYAGTVIGEVAAGRVTMEEVRQGISAKGMVDYGAAKVGESLTKLGVTPDTLAQMLIGKVDALVSPAVVAELELAKTPAGAVP